MIRRSHALFVLLVVVSIGTVGCAAAGSDESGRVPGESSFAASSVTSPTRSTFPNRLNHGNDGTSYEPCASLSPESALALRIDARSRTDAATVDHQTARGCDWRYTDGKWWRVSQIVGNSPGLERYKSTQSDNVWRNDLLVNGRVVGVGEFSNDTCTTHVQSGRAIVSTIVMYPLTNGPTIDEICNRAIEFTKATIDKMPP